MYRKVRTHTNCARRSISVDTNASQPPTPLGTTSPFPRQPQRPPGIPGFPLAFKVRKWTCQGKADLQASVPTVATLDIIHDGFFNARTFALCVYDARATHFREHGRCGVVHAKHLQLSPAGFWSKNRQVHGHELVDKSETWTKKTLR